MKLDLGVPRFDTNKPWNLPREDFHCPARVMSSIDWKNLLKRARRSDSDAEWYVADCYSDGCVDGTGKTIVRRSRAKAAYWFRRSAEHGNSSAYNNLGVMLSGGDGVEKNVEEALYWLKKAVKVGEASAAHNIAIIYRENGNLRRALHWFLKCAHTGDEDAFLDLGIHYFWGKGVKKNSSAAVECFRKTIRAENVSEATREDAFYYLGLAYFEGKGVKESIPTARRLFQRANIDGDHPAAQKMLSWILSLKFINITI